MSDDQAKDPTRGVRPEDARWWLAQWRREQGIEAKVQEWLDGPFSLAVEAAATTGKRSVRVAVDPLLLEPTEDRLHADGWDVFGISCQQSDNYLLVTWTSPRPASRRPSK